MPQRPLLGRHAPGGFFLLAVRHTPPSILNSTEGLRTKALRIFTISCCPTLLFIWLPPDEAER